jgi:hypothetical protein
VKIHATFSELLQAYFTDRLMRQRNASPNTVASHRDTFRLLLGFAQRVLGKPPTALTLDDLTPSFVGRFLDYLEHDRGNAPRSRNVRLAAIHSFFGYVALQEPALSALAQRVLAIPGKRYKTKPVDFSHPYGNRRPVGGPRSGDLDRTSRPDPLAGGGPNRTACFGVGRSLLSGRRVGHWGTCALYRQRT